MPPRAPGLRHERRDQDQQARQRLEARLAAPGAAAPARMSSSGVSTMTRDHLQHDRAGPRGWSVVQARTVAARQAADAEARDDRVHGVDAGEERGEEQRRAASPCRRSPSPSASTRRRGRSPRRYESTDSPTVTSRMTTEPSAPPTTEIVTRSHERDRRLAEGGGRRASPAAASHSDDANVVMTPTSTFCAQDAARGAGSTSNRPACVRGAEPRADRAEDRAAHADGGGDQDRRPGSASSVPVMWPSVSPATNDAAVLRTSATRPWRSVRRSARQ